MCPTCWDQIFSSYAPLARFVRHSKIIPRESLADFVTCRLHLKYDNCWKIPTTIMFAKWVFGTIIVAHMSSIFISGAAFEASSDPITTENYQYYGCTRSGASECGPLVPSPLKWVLIPYFIYIVYAKVSSMYISF